MTIFSSLPKYSYLPIAHVCKRFRNVYLAFKRPCRGNNHEDDPDDYFTNPLSIGNLFDKNWRDNQDGNNRLNVTLLRYYVENGYGGIYPHQRRNQFLKKVMLQTASRGDIAGMMYMSTSNMYKLEDQDIPSMAAAAGKLDTLKFLRGTPVSYDGVEYVLKSKCPWNAADAHREAAENCHDDVVDYIEKNSEGNQIHLSYGVGLPW